MRAIGLAIIRECELFVKDLEPSNRDDFFNNCLIDSYLMFKEDEEEKELMQEIHARNRI